MGNEKQPIFWASMLDDSQPPALSAGGPGHRREAAKAPSCWDRPSSRDLSYQSKQAGPWLSAAPTPAAQGGALGLAGATEVSLYSTFPQAHADTSHLGT